MKLRSVSYVEHQGEPREWRLDGLQLGEINLLVGKNASGKTRVLNILHGLARLLGGIIKGQFTSGDYDVVFDEQGTPLHYLLGYRDAKVVREEYRRGDTLLLERGPGGIGKVFAERMNSMIDFQSPENELAVVSRRDSLQHPFFEPLYQWGRSVRHYPFGSSLGKNVVALMVKDPRFQPDPTDAEQVVALFRKADREFPERFKAAVIADMKAVGYDLEEVGTMTPQSITIQLPFPADPVFLYVKEADIPRQIDQNDMSQGMFRALSILVHLNYAILAHKPSCILIDDIGEGLDFERSCSLIDVLMRKAQASSVQLLMSTNDRFVMNKVPLEAWSLLKRKGTRCWVYNYANSRVLFDEFKFTGLNNFDFLATDFVEETAAHE
jgi:energy-coupling factor transporter ATP-binding protein EcfA2